MIMLEVFEGFSTVLLDSVYALLPLFIILAVVQASLRLERELFVNALVGFVFTFMGIAFFLQGVHIGFMPLGERIGYELGKSPNIWILSIIGFMLGFAATYAEPAVRVMTYEVNKVTSGTIPEKVLLLALSFGVAGSVCLSMSRVYYGFSLWPVLLVGYALVFFLSFQSKEQFVAVAFDSGGVATGPMTVTFVLAVTVGFATVLEGRDPVVDGFGLISLVALAPIITVLLLGQFYKREEKKVEKKRAEEETSRDRCEDGQSEQVSKKG